VRSRGQRRTVATIASDHDRRLTVPLLRRRRNRGHPAIEWPAACALVRSVVLGRDGATALDEIRAPSAAIARTRAAGEAGLALLAPSDLLLAKARANRPVLRPAARVTRPGSPTSERNIANAIVSSAKLARAKQSCVSAPPASLDPGATS
jgi:hypothetical protein